LAVNFLRQPGIRASKATQLRRSCANLINVRFSDDAGRVCCP
jgi:hypothetical protein